MMQSLEPNEPTLEVEKSNPFNAWSKELSATFNEAYRLPDDAGLEAQNLGGEDVLQALSLPQLRSFLNNRF